MMRQSDDAGAAYSARGATQRYSAVLRAAGDATDIEQAP